MGATMADKIIDGFRAVIKGWQWRKNNPTHFRHRCHVSQMNEV
jgi:hypothetical protein